SGEYLPLREHRVGERTEAALPAHGHRHLGGHRSGFDKAIRISPVLSRPGVGRALHSSGPVLSIMEGEGVGFPYALHRTGGRDHTNMPYHVLASVTGALNSHKKSVNGARVLVLGVAYKKDIDDLRESPSLTIIELLQKQGAQVSYHDPYFPFIGRGRKYDLQMKCAELKNLG